MLWEAERGINLLYDMSHEMVLSVKVEEQNVQTWRIVRANEVACGLLGYSTSELVRLRFHSISEPSQADFWRGWVFNAESGVPIASNWRFLNKSGEEIHVDMKLLVTENPDGKDLLIVARPVSEMNKTSLFAGNTGDLYELMAEYTPDLVAIIDANRDVIFASPSHLSVLGFDPSKDKLSLLQAICPDDLDALQRTYLEVFQTGRTQSFHLRIKNKEGSYQAFESRVSLLPPTPHAPTRLVTVSMDISKRVRAEQELREMAYHDSLTGLGNRRLFMEEMESVIREAGLGSSVRPVLVMMDLNEFKGVNDSFGHAAGDLLLREVANRLRDAAPADSLIARMGGDEFTFCTNQVDDGDVFEFCKTVAERLGQPYDLRGETVHISVSIGAATIPDDGNSVDAVLKAADVAMYKDKARYRQGHNLR